MSTTPSPKIPGLDPFLRYIRHVFDGDMLDKQLYFSLTRRRRFKRLDLHSKRQRTVHEMCKRVIDQAPRETDIVIAFGNASWKQGKGYASSPRRLRFAKYFEQFHHHQRRPPDPSVSKIHVCSVNEFNTSQLPYAVGSRHQCLKEYDLDPSLSVSVKISVKVSIKVSVSIVIQLQLQPVGVGPSIQPSVNCNCDIPLEQVQAVGRSQAASVALCDP
ncbi:uncharacterized protein BJ171DRAFT_565342 [Polychytrium aggregatum]|uniref:uncharacterized protein n=1 Tax=Polychytrium aggregatum TaxID=110093 RepID=UPI0022FF2840|nr:uncharacterized protein BJ171DRAFT_565342 [Polychytrium aggregatum]KAI9208183.1 hypothetical protein BJ171DRAFT_565342 [Polychytrium aggregatum]